MAPRTRLLLVGLVALSGLAVLLGSLARTPTVAERSLVAATATRNVVDLVQAPAAGEFQFDGRTVALPLPTGRWLACILERDRLRVGWLDDPTGDVGDTVDVPAKGAVRVAAWPIRAEPDVVGVELRYGWTIDARTVSGRISISPP